ncbi:MAG: hypothetical protein GXY33_12040 [Phycisphaerae bacterium]|nr:hypothetical protein [Phycisphaerae bacterium]
MDERPTQAFGVECPHCGRVFEAAEMAPERECPSCGRPIGVVERAEYRPAVRSPVARVVAVVLLIGLLLLIAVGVIGLVLGGL